MGSLFIHSVNNHRIPGPVLGTRETLGDLGEFGVKRGEQGWNNYDTHVMGVTTVGCRVLMACDGGVTAPTRGWGRPPQGNGISTQWQFTRLRGGGGREGSWHRHQRGWDSQVEVSLACEGTAKTSRLEVKSEGEGAG